MTNIQILQQFKDRLFQVAAEHPAMSDCLTKFEERFWCFGRLLNHPGVVTEVREEKDGSYASVYFDDFSGCQLYPYGVSLQSRIEQFKATFPVFYRSWIKDKQRTAKKELKELQRKVWMYETEIEIMNSIKL